MKKLLILLGFLTLSLNLFSMQKEPNQIKQTPQKNQLSKREKVKVVAAILGSALFTTAAIFNPSLREAVKTDANATSWHIPPFITMLPVALIGTMSQKLGLKKLSEALDSADITFNIGTAYSSILAFILGSYAYKKLTQSNKQDSKKIDEPAAI